MPDKGFIVNCHPRKWGSTWHWVTWIECEFGTGSR